MIVKIFSIFFLVTLSFQVSAGEEGYDYDPLAAKDFIFESKEKVTIFLPLLAACDVATDNVMAIAKKACDLESKKCHKRSHFEIKPLTIKSVEYCWYKGGYFSLYSNLRSPKEQKELEEKGKIQKSAIPDRKTTQAER